MNKFVINNTALNLHIKDGVFIPTATTTNLINSVKSFVDRPGNLLDLGSGSGVVAIALSLDGIAKSPVYASDISEDSVKCVLDNCSKYNVPVVSKSGSLLEPWLDMKFDYIVDDISGILKKWLNYPHGLMVFLVHQELMGLI
jgi:methylase of polypeptide subunit release factors